MACDIFHDGLQDTYLNMTLSNILLGQSAIPCFCFLIIFDVTFYV